MSRNARHAILFTIAVFAVVLIGSYPADAAKGGKKGKPGGGDPPPPLPPVRYQLTLTRFPSDSVGGFLLRGMNNRGQVVGSYLVEGTGGQAFLYDPARDPVNVINLNDIPVAGVPDGFLIGSAQSINDHQVVVGYLYELDDRSNQLAYALDLGLEQPVVDLLPNLASNNAVGREINNAGDVLGEYTDAEGIRVAYLYNPGKYDANRDVGVRLPFDFRDDVPQLPPLAGLRPSLGHLNNPIDGRPAQVAGPNADGVAIRYTLGTAEPESFPELDLAYDVGGLNDSGVFCGMAIVPDANAKGKKNRTTTLPFRYGESLDLLPRIPPEPSRFRPELRDLNSSGDTISAQHIYRDDWEWIHMDQLVVGSDDDLAFWFLGISHLKRISNRGGAADAAQIVGIIAEVGDPILVLLTPVPVELAP